MRDLTLYLESTYVFNAFSIQTFVVVYSYLIGPAIGPQGQLVVPTGISVPPSPSPQDGHMMVHFDPEQGRLRSLRFQIVI